ncbi:MAG: winged helix-turn-helix domain-containing protein [Phycisphaerae bacterium]
MRIGREHESGGWVGTSRKTGKQIRIKSPQRLRKRIDDAAPGAKSAAKATQDAKRAGERDTGERAATGGQREANGAKRMSLLDAAAHLLSLGTGDPMRCQTIVDLAVAHGLWTPGEGKTPAATLHAAISREIKAKGDASRFMKAERGRFALASKA